MLQMELKNEMYRDSFWAKIKAKANNHRDIFHLSAT